MSDCTTHASKRVHVAQAVKVGEYLMDARIDSLMASPAERAVVTASQIAKCQGLTGDRAPRMQIADELADIAVGAFAGRNAGEVRALRLDDWHTSCPRSSMPHEVTSIDSHATQKRSFIQALGADKCIGTFKLVRLAQSHVLMSNLLL